MASRSNDSREALASALTFTQTSLSPTSVLRLQTYPVPTSASGTLVVVQMLAAAVNPQDFLITAGLYPIKPSHSLNEEQIPGYDGVGRVVSIGPDVRTLQPGDLVIPRGQGFGTWRTHAVVDASECARVPNCSDVRYAAILKMTVLPAYFIVEDLRALKPGDWIVQTAASSSIAQMVVQFTRLKGGRSINIIRASPDGNRDTDDKVKKMLLARGADVVCTDAEFEAQGKDIMQGKRVVVAVDCVWGKAAEVVIASLPPNALFVNFGNLSGGGAAAKASLSFSSLFGASGTLKGWKSTSSLAARTEAEFDDLTAWVVDLLEQGTLKMPDLMSVAWSLDKESDSKGERLQQRLLDAMAYASGGGARKKKVLLEFRK